MPLDFSPASEPFSSVVTAACHAVAADSNPVMVRHEKREHSEADECHRNAERMAALHGGSVQRGWSIRVMEPVSVWLEFHSVWIHPDGHLLDTTEPPSADVQSIAFLPDSSIGIAGPDLPSVHHPWDHHPDCLEFVELFYTLDRLFFPYGSPFYASQQVDRAYAQLLRNRMKELARSRKNQMKKAEQDETRNPH